MVGSRERSFFVTRATPGNGVSEMVPSVAKIPVPLRMDQGSALIILDLIFRIPFLAGWGGDGQETAFFQINCHAADRNQLQGEQPQYPGPITLAEGHDRRRLLYWKDARSNGPRCWCYCMSSSWRRLISCSWRAEAGYRRAPSRRVPSGLASAGRGQGDRQCNRRLR